MPQPIVDSAAIGGDHVSEEEGHVGISVRPKQRPKRRATLKTKKGRLTFTLLE